MAENRLLSIGLALLLLTVSLGLGWLAGRLVEDGSAPTAREALLPPPPTVPPGSAPPRIAGAPQHPGVMATVEATRPESAGRAPAAGGPTPAPPRPASPSPPAARATPIVLGQGEAVAPAPRQVPSETAGRPHPTRASNRPEASGRRPAAAPARLPLRIVQVAVVETREEADAVAVRLRELGFAPYLVATRGGFAVRLGAFRRAEHAAALVRRAEAAGVSVTVIVRP